MIGGWFVLMVLSFGMVIWLFVRIFSRNVLNVLFVWFNLLIRNIGVFLREGFRV